MKCKKPAAYAAYTAYVNASNQLHARYTTSQVEFATNSPPPPKKKKKKRNKWRLSLVAAGKNNNTGPSKKTPIFARCCQRKGADCTGTSFRAGALSELLLI